MKRTLYSKTGNSKTKCKSSQKPYKKKQVISSPAKGRQPQGSTLAQPTVAAPPPIENRLLALEDFANRCVNVLQSMQSMQSQQRELPDLFEVQVCEAKTLTEANQIAQERRNTGFVCTQIQRSPELDTILLELKRPVYFRGVQT